MTLTSKLIFGGILVVLLPTVSVGVLSTSNSRTGVESLFKSHATTMATSLATLVQTSLSQDLNTLKAISVESGLRDVTAEVVRGGSAIHARDVEALNGRLKAVVATVGHDYESIAVFDHQGIVFSDSDDGKRKGISIADRAYFKAALQGNASVGEVVISKATGNPIIPLVVPIYSEEKQVEGVLGLMLKCDYLLEKITQIKFGRTGFVVVVNKQGMTIAHPNKSNILKVDIKSAKGMEEMARGALAGETGCSTYFMNGVKKLSGYAPVDLTGWSILVTQTYDELFAPIASMQTRIFLSAGALLAIVSCLVFLLGRKISKPIAYTAYGLSEASNQILSASSQISSASEQLASGASQQAAAIEEISSSLEEMASMTRQNSEHADQANTLTLETRTVVEEAHESMDNLTSSMTAISHASRETQKIIKTIDEIAFQTNLLALNAAVEAARAGEAGAGFAVVADEVRNLALRASEASRNTTGLIEEMVKRIQEGSVTLTTTQEGFSHVEARTARMGELMHDISAASREQAQGIAQISKAVSEMDQVVQHNAAGAEESASFSRQMNAQAEHMKKFTRQLTTLIGNNSENGTAALPMAPSQITHVICASSQEPRS